MEKLTAEVCRKEIEWIKSSHEKGQVTELTMLLLQALEIALPVLEQQERGEWIEWGGKGTPVNDPMVEVRFRDGELDKALASHWVWFHSDSEDDIIAYRIINQKEG